MNSVVYETPHSIEYVWKVARYTSAAPVFFSECDNYVDGGVLANNPCQYGLAEIQNFHLHRGQKLPISLVVSVGTGIYPQEKLGSIDAHDYLLPGMHWLNFKDALKTMSNLLQLFSNAVSSKENLQLTKSPLKIRMHSVILSVVLTWSLLLK